MSPGYRLYSRNRRKQLRPTSNLGVVTGVLFRAQLTDTWSKICRKTNECSPRLFLCTQTGTSILFSRLHPSDLKYKEAPFCSKSEPSFQTETAHTSALQKEQLRCAERFLENKTTRFHFLWKEKYAGLWRPECADGGEKGAPRLVMFLSSGCISVENQNFEAHNDMFLFPNRSSQRPKIQLH